MSSPEILSPVSILRVGNATLRGSNTSLAHSPSSSPRNSNKLKCVEIQTMLKTKPGEYIIIENTGKHTSDCWTLFGFPAIVNSNGDLERINGFVSCRKCFSTYSFISNSTRLLNQHACEKSNERNRKLTGNSTSSTQRSLTAFYSAQPVSLQASQIKKIKDLQAEWVCHSIRPFSIVEDDGLRRLVQECISIGKHLIVKL